MQRECAPSSPTLIQLYLVLPSFHLVPSPLFVFFFSFVFPAAASMIGQSNLERGLPFRLSTMIGGWVAGWAKWEGRGGGVRAGLRFYYFILSFIAAIVCFGSLGEPPLIADVFGCLLIYIYIYNIDTHL